MKLVNFRVFLFLFLIPGLCHSFVHNRTSFGSKVQWPSDSQILSIYIDTANNDSLDRGEVLGVFNSSAGYWNAASGITLNGHEVVAGTNATENYVEISSNNIFGAGVVAYTEMAYNTSNGEIYYGHIYLNDSYTFSTDSTDTDNSDLNPVFIGDIFTHELGHMIGMSHSLSKESSMFYSVYRGQYVTAADDNSGAYDLYPATKQGTIYGRVIGGDELVGIFGAYVSAISYETGEVAGANLSNSDGTFGIPGLDTTKTYYLMISPIKESQHLPIYYSGAQTNFCPGGSFKTSFYSKCGESEEGYPYGIEFNSSDSMNVGNITISCGTKSPTSYLVNKDGTPTDGFALDIETTTGNFGNSFVGFFSEYDSETIVPEKITIDLTGYADATTDHYLEIRVNSQKYFSKMRTEMLMERDSAAVDLTVADLSTDDEGNYSLELLGRLAMSATTTENTYEITLTPSELIKTAETYTNSDFFPDADHFVESLPFYLFSARIVKYDGSTYETVSKRSYNAQSDNSYCPDGPYAYETKPYVNDSDIDFSARKKPGGNPMFSCATTTDGPPPPSSGSAALSFSLGLLLILLLNILKQRFIPIRLSKRSILTHNMRK
ncbi:MAG: matrixin family metalloprotease [Bacteriovoracaceae bacterium]|jgi:hypothetical protein|nr:matrixin family metalloprotease [Bacteriovoracaceae bacterium]